MASIDKVVKSFNIFLDSDRGNSSQSKGDSFALELNGVNIDVNRNQFIRLNLNSFSMHKVWSNVNQYNSQFTLVTNEAAAPNRKTTLNLEHTNFSSVKDLARNLKDVLIAALPTLCTTGGTTVSLQQVANAQGVLEDNLLPSSSSASATDGIIEFVLEFSNAHGLNDVLIQFYESYGASIMDTYSLLGGDRIKEDGITSTNVSTSSIEVSSPTPTTLKVKGKYHAQRMTESFVYLRLQQIPTNNLETQSFRDATTTGRNNRVHHSEIFARFPMSDEFITYQSGNEREYFIDVQQKHLNNMQLTLTDSHNNALPQGANQSTLGNLSFSAVLRVDVIERYALDDQHSGLQIQNMPRRFNNLILSQGGHTQQL